MHNHRGRRRRPERRWQGTEVLAGRATAQELEEIAEEETLRSLCRDATMERRERMADRRSQVVWRAVMLVWLLVLTLAVGWLLAA